MFPPVLEHGGDAMATSAADDLFWWIERYIDAAVCGVRPPAVQAKLVLHLERFATFYKDVNGHTHLARCLPRDIAGWREHLCEKGQAPSTVNNHLASLGGFMGWLEKKAGFVFALGNPTQGIGTLPLPPLEPRALNLAQVRSLKNICDRLKLLHSVPHGDNAAPQLPSRSRPGRDRAIVFVLLSTGLRRDELVQLNLAQLEHPSSAALRACRKAHLFGVRGKGKTRRTVFLSLDARLAVADYLADERPRDAACSESPQALFLSAYGAPDRRPCGRLSGRSINYIVSQIGRWHDAEVTDPSRRIVPLRPHDLRHTFAFLLAKVTNADVFELERRLGHRSQRYIHRYTNPPEEVAAGYVERF